MHHLRHMHRVTFAIIDIDDGEHRKRESIDDLALGTEKIPINIIGCLPDLVMGVSSNASR